jgi:hypothetical protein
MSRELLAKLQTQDGRFAKELAADLAPAVEAGDTDALHRIASEAPQRPAKWLIEEYLGW